VDIFGRGRVWFCLLQAKFIWHVTYDAFLDDDHLHYPLSSNSVVFQLSYIFETPGALVFFSCLGPNFVTYQLNWSRLSVVQRIFSKLPLKDSIMQPRLRTTLVNVILSVIIKRRYITMIEREILHSNCLCSNSPASLLTSGWVLCWLSKHLMFLFLHLLRIAERMKWDNLWWTLFITEYGLEHAPSQYYLQKYFLVIQPIFKRHLADLLRHDQLFSFCGWQKHLLFDGQKTGSVAKPQDCSCLCQKSNFILFLG
jgi:hypothetical protein